jgi:hypothetical protein
MRNQTFLLTACAALLWSSAAAAQTMTPATPVRQPATSPSPSQPTPANATTANPVNNPANVTTRTRNRVRVATAVTNPNQRDCTQLRGIEKSECERRDTVRDDLPAGVTSTQKAQPPQ